jgi:hypothetical protein
MTFEETEKYALLTTIRHGTRKMWEEKIGSTRYSITRYQKLLRATIPLADSHLLLLSLDADTDTFDSIIMGKIIPLIEKYHLDKD